jgi:nucleotide-binding universal stress UspA family protein
MAGLDQIVVALSGSEGDQALVAYVKLLAKLGRTRDIRFVHVADSDTPAVEMRDRMRALAAAELGNTPVQVQCDVVQGSLTDRLLAYVSEFQADLVLIGAKKHKLGSRLAMVAPCSVAVVPTDHQARLTHMMVAIDFSEAAVKTLNWAAAIAAGDPSIRVTAVHVMTPESADMFADGEGTAEQSDVMRTLLERAQTQNVSIDSRLVNVVRTSEVGRNRPYLGPASIQGADVAHAILQEAEKLGADCIALSTRGRSRSASILLGSVTEKVIERANVPLLVGKHSHKNLGLASILLGHAGWSAGIKTN